jgi:uncharacterized delta-60 repeat protein
VSRTLAGGALNSGFGDSGQRQVDFIGSPDTLQQVAVAPDNSIYVLGGSTIAAGNDVVLARLTATGDLNTSFSTDGMFEINLGDNETARAVLFSGSRVIVVGTSGATTFLASVTAAGAYDNTWDSDGVLFFGPWPQAAATLSNGSILIAGEVNNQFALGRVTSTGAADNTFGTDGILMIPALNGFWVNSIVEDASGRIILGGFRPSGLTQQLVRLTSGYALDTTFSGDGIDSVAGGTGDQETITSLSIDPSSGYYWVFGQFRPYGAALRFIP